jgi:hypothetical protein
MKFDILTVIINMLLKSWALAPCVFAGAKDFM